jgi:N-acetylneuraminic acid mutarotase
VRCAALVAATVLLSASCSSGDSTASVSSSASSSPSSSGTTTPSSSATPFPQPRTQQAEVPLPEPREETAAAALHERLYVIGGFDAGGSDTDSVFVFGGAVWTRGPRLPVAVDHASAAVLGDRLYVVGGSTPAGASTAAFVLSSSGDAWQRITPLRHARIAPALVATSGRLYAIGGRDGLAEVGPAEVYDPESARWGDLPPLPLPRDHVSGFVDQGMPCVAGGRSPNTTRVDCFDSAAAQWRSLPPLPRPTSGAGGVTLAGQVIVAGGEDAAESVIVDQVARFADGAWSLDSMLVPRHGFQLAVLGGRAWACGGGDHPGLHPVATCTSIT